MKLVYAVGMTISFPNPSRSYDARHHCVRFWGHDGPREVAFLIDEAALTRIDATTPRTEHGFLLAFDGNRDRIFTVAGRAYSPRGGGFYALAVSDF